MHADQVPTTPPDELPVTPQEEAAFRSLASFDPAELDGPTRINVTTMQDAEPVYREVARPLALPDVQQEVQGLLLMTIQRTHGSTDFPAAVHTETVSLVSREDLATSIRQIARHEDAFCAAHGPRFIRHRLLGVSNITLPVPVSDLLELAGIEDLQALLAGVPA